MKVRSFFDTDHNENNDKTDLKVYQSLIEKLIYLTCSTRPHILFIVGQLERYNSDPRVVYMQIAKQVVRYLKETISLMFYYRKKTKVMRYEVYRYDLDGYVDSNYASNLEYKKFVIRYYFFFNKALAIWSNKKQRTVSISITKIEYIALSHETQKVVWLKRLINELMP